MSKTKSQPVPEWILALVILPAIFLALGAPYIINNIQLFALISFLVIVLIGATFLLIVHFQNYQKRQRLKAISISQIDSMAGVDFENFVGELLKHQGYSVGYTKVSGDYGVDIIARKGGVKVAVQVKRWTYLVGRSAISDAVAGQKFYSCNQCMAVTSSYFSKEAKNLAKINGCQLVDRDGVADWIRRFCNE